METKYKDFYKNSEKNGKLVELELDFWKPAKIGDSLLGRVDAVEMVQGSKGAVYGRYTVDTDEGVKTVNFGRSIDMLFKNNDPVGRIFKFQYEGMQRNTKGDEFHKYIVTEVL
jgi:hypothetical protein